MTGQDVHKLTRIIFLKNEHWNLFNLHDESHSS